MIRYLESIQSGKSINYPAFVRKASSYGFSESVIRACFKVSKDTKKKGNFYFLEIKNNDLYIANFSRFFEVNENKKVELSVHGNSKKAKSDFSHLLIKLNHYDVVPWVVVFDKNEYKYLFKEKLKKKIIIIENEDSFGNLEQSFHNEQLDLSEFNFILGFGNYITDRNFREFLNSYDHVICFLDIDLGGLKTFASLKANLSSKTTFYFSNKMEDYLRAYGNEIGDKAYLQALSFINSPGLDQVVKAIKQHKKFAEQEIFPTLGLIMDKQIYRLNIAAFHNSANSNFVSLDFRKSIHIIGDNGIGKTAKLNGLQIGYLPHTTFKGTDRKFNFDKEYTDEMSYDFYFPSQNSYIVFEFENPHGTFCEIVYKGVGELSIERAFVPLKYDEVLSWLWTFEDNDEVGSPTRINRKDLISKILSVKGHKILKQAKDAKDVMYNGSLTNYELGKYSIASVNENRVENILDLLKISSNVGSINSDMLRKILISLLNTSYQDNQKDQIKYDPNALMEQFGRLRSEKEALTQKRNYLDKYNDIKSNFQALKSQTEEQDYQYSLISLSIRKIIQNFAEKIDFQQENISSQEEILAKMTSEGNHFKLEMERIISATNSLKTQQFAHLDTREKYEEIMHSEESHWRLANGNPERAIELMDESILSLKEQIKDAKNIDKTIKDLRKLQSSEKTLQLRKTNIRSQIENLGNLLISNQKIQSNSGKLIALNPAFSSIKDELSDKEINIINDFISLFSGNEDEPLVLNGISFGTVRNSVRSITDLLEDEQDIETELRSIQKDIAAKMKTVDNLDKNLLPSLTNELNETRAERKIITRYQSIKDLFERNENEIKENDKSLAIFNEKYLNHREAYKIVSSKLKGLKSELKVLKDSNTKYMNLRSRLEILKGSNNYTLTQINIEENALLSEVSDSHIREIEHRFESIKSYKKDIGFVLREFQNLNMLEDPKGLLAEATVKYNEIESTIVSQLDEIFESLESDEESLNDAFMKQAQIIRDLSGDLEHHLSRYKSYIKKLNRQLDQVSLSSIESILLDVQFHPRVERFIEVISNLGLDSDDAISAMDKGLEEAIRSFIIDMGLDRNKNMKIDIDTMIQKVSMKYINEHKFATNKGSNGTSIITSILLLSMFTREICGEDIAILMPINLDEITSVDRHNMEVVHSFLQSKDFSLFSASPSIPTTSIELYDTIIPLLDFKNTDSDKLISSSTMTYHHHMSGIIDNNSDDIQIIDEEQDEVDFAC